MTGSDDRPTHARLYWFAMSHPAQAARAMLELKRIGFSLETVMPGTQRIHLRLAGFRDGTVPALKLNGKRIQGSRQIARAVERLRPDPPLFPQDAADRERVLEAERWGDEVFQAVPRILFRWGLVHDADLRAWLAERSSLPMPTVASWMSLPVAWYYARLIDADETAAREAVRALPNMLDRVDSLLSERVLATDPPNAAALQILSTVRALDAFSDLQELLADRSLATAARTLFPHFPGPVPHFIPREWIRSEPRAGS